jgi:Outer membrane protein beta-barrel domain
MIKRLNQSIALCMALTTILQTQANGQFSIGFESGYNKNYLITNVSNLVSTQYNSLSGFSVGVPVVYQVADWFSLKAVPTFVQKNYQMQRTGFYQGVYQNNTNGYIQLPIMGQFSFGGDALRGFVDIGGYAGYWLTGHVKGTMPNILNQPAYTNTSSNAQPNNVFDEFTPYNYNEKYTFNNTKDNRLELGVLAGAGLSYQLTDTYKLYGGATYYNSLTDLQKKYQTGLVPRYNTTYVFSLGVLYTIQ